jgi:hypothetical protein
MNIMNSQFWELYKGKREILGEALIHHDPYDQFAWCQEWRFALADYITFVLGEHVPDFFSGWNGPNKDSYAYSEVLVAVNPDSETCWYALRILDRYREWLRIAGKDY